MKNVISIAVNGSVYNIKNGLAENLARSSFNKILMFSTSSKTRWDFFKSFLFLDKNKIKHTFRINNKPLVQSIMLYFTLLSWFLICKINFWKQQFIIILLMYVYYLILQ